MYYVCQFCPIRDSKIDKFNLDGVSVRSYKI